MKQKIVLIMLLLLALTACFNEERETSKINKESNGEIAIESTTIADNIRTLLYC